MATVGDVKIFSPKGILSPCQDEKLDQEPEISDSQNACSFCGREISRRILSISSTREEYA